MMKKWILLIFFFAVILLCAGCHQGIVPDPDTHNDNENENEANIKVQSFLLVKGALETIKDCTPELTILTELEDVKYMSFSGNGKDWSKWVQYVETYDQFNIASGNDGTTMDSGLKTIYVRFQDKNGTIFPKDFQEPPCCTFEYEIQKLFSIKILPDVVEIKGGGKQEFIAKGYDLFLNEVPVDGQKIKWSKPCGTGDLTPETGLITTYTAPDLPGSIKNISAYYGSLGSGAKIYIK